MTCEKIPKVRFKLKGFVGEYVKNLTDHWLLLAPRANPAMLEMFRDRDASPLRHMQPWSGEFAGKYLLGAVQVLRVTGDPRLRAHLEEFVPQLLRYQDKDGYLGPWPKEYRLTNAREGHKYAPENHKRTSRDEYFATWDTWSHYFIMTALIFWHEDTGDKKALRAATKIADMICKKYIGKKPGQRLVDTPFGDPMHSEMNLAPIHGLCLLYRKTKKPRHLRMALQIADQFAAQGKDGPIAGDYLRGALAGKEFYELPRPRWESLHPIMGLVELHRITGDEEYRQAFEKLWWSIVRHDRHNNGGFSSGEKATGNPYDLNAIETCCTIAWMAMSVDMLKLTGNSLVADELELSTLNSIVGAHSISGRWATYSTPMNGVRHASYHSIRFQAREGGSELNCCSVNAPRGFGLISDWALLLDESGLLLNWYGPSEMAVALEDGVRVTLIQETDYPVSGRILIRVRPSRASTFSLKLRIPQWSARTRVKINGRSLSPCSAGEYLTIARRWKRGDIIQLDLDMSFHFWRGERECSGKTAIYRGPILLAYDHRYNLALTPKGKKQVRPNDEYKLQFDTMLSPPALDAKHLNGRIVKWPDWMPPVLLLKVKAADGRSVHLCDFGSAGGAGTPYLAWLKVKNAPKRRRFSNDHPLPSARS